MASKYPPSFTNKDLGDLAKMAKAAAAKRPKSKPKPFNQQEDDRQSGGAGWKFQQDIHSVGRATELGPAEAHLFD